MFALKGSHKSEMNKMADYISRLERKLDQKDREIENLRRQLGENDPFIQCFEEMWSWEENRKQKNGKKKPKSTTKEIEKCCEKFSVFTFLRQKAAFIFTEELSFFTC